MKPLTSRDRWLAAFIPAMVILLAGWYFFLRPASRQVTQLRQSVEKQGSLSLKLAQAQSGQAEGVRLQSAIASMRSAAAGQTQSAVSANPAVQSGLPAPSPLETGVFDRNSALQQVSILSALYGMTLDGTSSELGGRLPPSLQDATSALSLSARAVPPQVWRIELSGSYPSMVRLLEGLQKATPLIVPLNLSMVSDKNERKPLRWVLTLWL